MSPDDEDFAAMFAESEAQKPRSGRRPRVGDVIAGKVITIGKEAVFVDLGGKAEGQVDRAQVSDADGKLLVQTGDTIEARVVADDGGVFVLRAQRVGANADALRAVSRGVGRGPEARAELQQAFDHGLPVDGTVTEVVKGGVSVDIAGVRAFCPASQLDVRPVADLATLVGQRLTFRITRHEARNLVVSRRALLDEERERAAVETRKKLAPGAVVRGKVVGFKPFGAFVDLGGIEGMLHISELGHTRVDKPEDVLRLGQELDVAILKLEGDRISLSLKALAADPWRDATASLAEGSRVRGTITRLQPFGAFVEIAPGVEGLVHISELGAGRRINHPKEVVGVGQQVEATVVAVDHDRRRLGLSLAASHDATAAEIAEAAPRAPQKLGTFGDLLQRKK